MEKPFARIVVILCALTIVFGALGRFHPLGDSLSIFRVPASLVCLYFSLRLFRVSWLFPTVSLACIVILSVYALGRYDFAGGGLFRTTIYQKNLSFRLADTTAFIEDVQMLEPSFITLQEVTEQNWTNLLPLREEYQTALLCPFAAVGGVAVLSRHASVEGTETCHNDLGAATVQVETPNGPVWVTSLHARWPFPFDQAKQMDRLVPELNDLKGRGLIGGDFNMVPWGWTVRRFQANRVSATQTTFKMEWLIPISIDHVLGKYAASELTDRRPLLGSDHYGLFVTVDWGS